MERSQVNLLIDDALDFFQQMNFRLPEFATYTITQWQKVKQEAVEILYLLANEYHKFLQ
jgi:D-lyxose ketol-isomerase